MGNIQFDLFNAMSDIIGDDVNDDDVKQFMAMVEAMPIEEQFAFHASRFLAREAIVNDEPRLFHAAFAMLVMSSIGEHITAAAEAVTVSDIMDLADRAWADTKKVADQALSTLVDKMVEE